MAKPVHVTYENNPFFIGLNGLKLFFSHAQQVAIYAIVLAVLGFVVNLAVNIVDTVSTIGMTEAELDARDRETAASMRDFFMQDGGVLAVYGVLAVSAFFVSIVVWLLLYGVLEYTAARLAQNHKVSLKEAFTEVGRNLASYLWLYIVLGVKLFGWYLLFIVPGIIMTVRYSLAGTVFFAEGKRGNAAVKRSAELTKGVWFTTYAGQGLWNLITFSQITGLIMPGANAIMYRQLHALTDAKHQKPPAHWLSWLTFFVPLAFVVLFGLLMGLVIAILIAASVAP